jgi:hypothetical protein
VDWDEFAATIVATGSGGERDTSTMPAHIPWVRTMATFVVRMLRRQYSGQRRWSSARGAPWTAGRGGSSYRQLTTFGVLSGRRPRAVLRWV